MTTLLPPGVKVHLALGYVDMRKGIDGLAMLVQGLLRQDPFTGHLFVFRGRTRANLIKIVFWDGTGLCLFTKRLEHGVFLASERRTGRDAIANLGATVVADRWRGLARAGTTLATGDSGITAAAV
jgi:transposase